MRDALDDPNLVKMLVVRNFNATTLWYVTVALQKQKTAIEAVPPENPDLLVKLVKLMGDNLAIGERFAKVRAPAGRPKTTVGVQVNVTPYDKQVRAADETGQNLLEAELLGDDDDGTEEPE